MVRPSRAIRSPVSLGPASAMADEVGNVVGCGTGTDSRNNERPWISRAIDNGSPFDRLIRQNTVGARNRSELFTVDHAFVIPSSYPEIVAP